MDHTSGTQARALLLTGTVGSGKTSVADTVGDLLSDAGIANAVIDVDWLRRSGAMSMTTTVCAGTSTGPVSWIGSWNGRRSRTSWWTLRRPQSVRPPKR